MLDVLTEDAAWFTWSSEAHARAAEDGPLAINPIVYAEVSIGFDRIEDLEAALPSGYFQRAPLPWEAGFLAGKCFVRYRRAGGVRWTDRRDVRGHVVGAGNGEEDQGYLTRRSS